MKITADENRDVILKQFQQLKSFASYVGFSCVFHSELEKAVSTLRQNMRPVEAPASDALPRITM